MDKRTVYGHFQKNLVGVEYLECAQCSKDESCKADPCKGCTEYALANPAELSALERQVETLNTSCAKKDEALDAGYSALRCLDSCFEKSGDQCVFGGEEKPCRAVRAKSAIIAALSLTPASAKEAAEYERIGRAVVEWLTEFKAETEALPYQLEDRGKGSCVYNWHVHFIRTLDKVISKAREVTPHA